MTPSPSPSASSYSSAPSPSPSPPSLDQAWFFTLPVKARQYLVEYRTRQRRIDQYVVHIPPEQQDDPAVAELAAMHQALVVRQVLGEGRGGSRVKLTVSRGVIRKAARRATDKSYLVPLARFLSTRYAQARLEVDHLGRWREAGIWRSPIQEMEAACSLGTPISLPGLGAAEVSHHVIEQLARRYQVDGLEQAWRLLARASSDHGFREIAGKQSTGTGSPCDVGGTRYFYHPGTGMQLVVACPAPGTTTPAVVVTAYFRAPGRTA